MSRKRARAVDAKRRSFITPEGVNLELVIASSGLRLGALMLDTAMMVAAGLGLFFGLLWLGVGVSGSLAYPLWLLGAFVLRNGWFIGFELGQRGATPGKRLVGIRVVARDGGRLTADAVVARNLLRELELFLPLQILSTGGGDDGWGTLTIVAGLAWALGLSMFLWFNRDRMRMGDLIAGTWVVMAQRPRLAADLAAGPAADAIQFTEAELAAYGIYELQELERMLRTGDKAMLAEIAATIAAKIGRAEWRADDRAFLDAYYRALKARLELKLLFGKRRADKFAAD